MPAGLIALRHDGLHTGVNSGTPFGDARHGGKQYDARSAKRPNALRRGQSKVETHHARLICQKRGQHGVVFHETAIDLLEMQGRLGAQPLEVRPKVLEPCRLGDAVGFCRLMTEDIHIQGALGALADRRNHSARALRIGRTDADRTQRAGVGYGRRKRG